MNDSILRNVVIMSDKDHMTKVTWLDQPRINRYKTTKRPMLAYSPILCSIIWIMMVLELSILSNFIKL